MHERAELRTTPYQTRIPEACIAGSTNAVARKEAEHMARTRCVLVSCETTSLYADAFHERMAVRPHFPLTSPVVLVPSRLPTSVH